MRESKAIRIAIVSPGDVTAERAAAKQAILDLEPIIRKIGFSFDRVQWEEVTPGYDEQGAQARIDKQLQIPECDLVIGIFAKRFGNAAAGGSGTAKEIGDALEARRSGKDRPEIMVYFCSTPPPRTSPEEERDYQRLLEFKRGLQRPVLTGDYTNALDLQNNVMKDVLDFGIDLWFTLPADPEAPVCRATSSPSLVHSEGYAELLGEIQISIPRSVAAGTQLSIAVTMAVNTNVTNRPQADGLTDIALMNQKSNQVLARGRTKQLAPGQFIWVQFGPIQLERDRPSDLRIVGLRADSEFLQAGGQISSTLIVTRVEGELEDNLLTERLPLALTMWQTGFAAYPLAQRTAGDQIQRFVLRFSQAFPGAFKARSEDGEGQAGGADYGTLFCVSVSNVPPGVEIFASARDVPTTLGRRSGDTLGRAAAVETDSQGLPRYDRLLDDSAPAWPGEIGMVRVDGLVAWELRVPIRSQQRDMSFGLAIVGSVAQSGPHAIRLAGGLGPFYGGSFSPNPRNGVALPVPRFVPGDSIVDLLI